MRDLAKRVERLEEGAGETGLVHYLIRPESRSDEDAIEANKDKIPPGAEVRFIVLVPARPVRESAREAA